MEQDIFKHISKVFTEVESILLLCNLAEVGIESCKIKKAWDIYLLFSILKLLCYKAKNNLRKIEH